MSEGIPAGGPYRAAIGMHDTLTLEHLRAARSTLSTYCRSPEYCREYIRVLEEASRLVARARARDLGGEYRGVDRGVLDAIGRILEFYASYLAGLYMVSGEQVLVEAVEEVSRGGVPYQPGDIMLLDPGDAATLYAAGLVKPVHSLALHVPRLHGDDTGT